MPAGMLNAVGVCDALRRLLSRPRLAVLAADEDEEPYVFSFYQDISQSQVGSSAIYATPTTWV